MFFHLTDQQNLSIDMPAHLRTGYKKNSCKYSKLHIKKLSLFCFHYFKQEFVYIPKRFKKELFIVAYI